MVGLGNMVGMEERKQEIYQELTEEETENRKIVPEEIQIEG